MQESVKEARASAYKNREFICIETCSGYGISYADPKGKQHVLTVDADDLSLGNATLDSLAHSRFLLPKEDPELFSWEENAKRYRQWVTDLMGRYGYKSRRSMFKDMHSCNIEKVQEKITISPSWHEKLEYWSGTGLKGADNVVIPKSSSPAEVGAALRLAFSRCR